MKSVCLIDTSVFLEILNVPGKAGMHGLIIRELEEKIRDGEGLFLPMATIFETGNHIGQIGDGSQRRDRAEVFVKQVEMAIAGTSPFVHLNFVEATVMQRWLSEFPNWTRQRSGLGDLSIYHDWQDLCQKHRGRRVYIWSLDKHLASFDKKGN
jgi:hypothetical protein